MALDGGGGGGGPIGVSNSFVGPQSNFELVGDHIYGVSGAIPTDNNETTLFESNTGNFYTRLKIQFWYATTSTTEITEDYVFRVYLGDSLLLSSRAKANTEYFTEQYAELIVPSYTTLKITAQNATDSDSRNMSMTLSGRIYRA